MKDNNTSGGQDIVTGLLGSCLKWAEIVLTRYNFFKNFIAKSQSYVIFRQGKIDGRFKSIYEKLYEIRNQLERLSLTQAWSLRETDLYDFQRRLDRIDESRISGNFEDLEGNKADLHTQRVIFPSLSALSFVVAAKKNTDVALSSQTQLCLHIQSYYFLRASFRSLAPCFQSIADFTTLPS